MWLEIVAPTSKEIDQIARAAEMLNLET